MGGPLARAETLDRVVASVDSRAITQHDVETEYRFEQFAEGEMPVAPGAAALAEVRDRLVDQQLLADEAESSTVQTPTTEASGDLEEIRKKFSTPSAYAAALKATGLDESEILRRLRRRDRILKMIDQRLRPDAWVSDVEIQDYYTNTFLPEYQRKRQGAAPSLESVTDEIRKILTEKKINQLLDEWLKELRSSHLVRIHSF